MTMGWCCKLCDILDTRHPAGAPHSCGNPCPCKAYGGKMLAPDVEREVQKAQAIPYFELPLNQGRFMRRLAFRASEDDCWIWASSCFKRNKGKYKVPFFFVKMADKSQKQMYARRFAWEMVNGKALPEGYSVFNVCNEHLCVRPHEHHNVAMPTIVWSNPALKLEYMARHGLEIRQRFPKPVTQEPGVVVIATTVEETKKPQGYNAEEMAFLERYKKEHSEDTDGEE